MSNEGPRSEQRKIGDRFYSVTQMPPSRAVQLQMQLVQLALPLLPMFASLSESGTEDAIAKAVSSFAEVVAAKLGPQEFYELARSLTEDGGYVMAGNDQADLAPLIFEKEFMGDNLSRMYPVLWFILEVNYARFFNGLGLGKIVAGAKALSNQMNSKE